MLGVKRKLLTSFAITTLCLPLGVHSKTYELSNADSTQTTSDIYRWIANLPNRASNSVLSGAFGGYTRLSDSNAFSMNESNSIFDKTNQHPAIYACDYARGWDTTEAGFESDLVNYDCNSALIEHWNRGGLVQISNHLPNPVFEGNLAYFDSNGKPVGGLKAKVSNAELSNLLVESSDARVRWLSILDKVADGLQELEDAGVPVIYRPLHEMNGEWFWWGASEYNSTDLQRHQIYIALYKDMYNYFTNTKQLDNLIWVYSPDSKRNSKTDFYPGPEYVDIVGLDAYIDIPMSINGYCDMLSLNKPFAFAEVGPDRNKGQFDYQLFVETIKIHFPQTAYFLPWNDVWSPLNNKNIYGAFNHNQVVNLGEIWEGKALTEVIESPSENPSVIFDFEGTTDTWNSSSDSVVGYWPVDEWSCSGESSLKADIELFDQDLFEIKMSNAIDLAGKSTLTALVRLADWGNVGSGLKAKFYLKAGSEYQWHDSGESTIFNGETVLLSINLNKVSDASDIKEMGVYFATDSASGYTSVYIDKVTAF